MGIEVGTMNANSDVALQIKATRHGFTLVPSPEASFESLMAVLEQKLRESHAFFRDAEMLLDLRGKALQTDQIAQLHALLSTKAGVKIMEVRLADQLSFLLEPPVPPRAPAKPNAPVVVDYSDAAVVVRNTCRSGTRIESPSDCVILGDVNPGAEVLAIGDVIVFGTLRGIAHAGASGDRGARIWALSIEPSQIRIADLVSVPPRGGKSFPKRYEIAEVHEDVIELITV
jgi:septum site-determining protein MinC